MNTLDFANTGRGPYKRGQAPYGTPNHWTTWFVEQLAVHKTVHATLEATGINSARLYARMGRDEQFRLAVERVRVEVPPHPAHFKPKPKDTDVADLL